MSRSTRVKLICGLIFQDQQILKTAKQILTNSFGPIDFESRMMPFDYTDYYEPEFGKGLLRQFISFEKLVPAQDLAKIKNQTIKIEAGLSEKGKRRINIDPGYLDLAKLVLATTKDFAHRVYLNDGIYADITLAYKKDSFTHYDWTYPDYRTKDYLGIFNRIRGIYEGQINKD